MGSIFDERLRACKSRIWQAAKVRAFDYGIPWRLEDLRRAAFDGICAAVEEGRFDEKLGAPFEQQAWRWAKEAARRKGAGLRQSNLAGELPEPSDAQIREALETFSAEEWCDLIGRFESRDADALVRYLQDNLDEAANILGVDKFQSVFDAANERGMILDYGVFVQFPYKIIVPTDPMWAALLWRGAREANLQHQPRSKMRTSAESGSYSGIAASLSLQGRKVHAVQVRRWLDRLREYPEWKDFLDRRGPKPKIGRYFWHKIADPRGYERRWRPLEDRD